MNNRKSFLIKAVEYLAIVATTLYPCFFMYFKNVEEGYFYEIFSASARFLGGGIVICIVALFLLKNRSKSILFANIAMLLFMNFNILLKPIKAIIPQMRKAYFLIILMIVLLGIFIIIKRSVVEFFHINLIMVITFSALIFVNFLGALPQILEREEIIFDNNDIANMEFTKDKPNVYYLFFDEYPGFESVKRYYDYDNAEFEKFLLDTGFNISYQSMNTESIWTSTILPNLLNLSYVASDEQASRDNLAKTESAAMYQLFWKNGYEVNLINHTSQLKETDCNVLNTGQKKETLSTYIIANSIFEEIDSAIDWVIEKATAKNRHYGLELLKIFECLKDCVNHLDKDSPTLTVSYICSPHTYFVLDANGNLLPLEKDTDWKDKSVFLGQMEYTTKCIQETVQNILTKDPDALIIIQSDHGVRYPHWMVENYGEEPYDALEETKYMQNIINCVYYKGQKIEIEGLTGINTIRKVFNEVLGTQMEMLEAPTGYKPTTSK